MRVSLDSPRRLVARDLVVTAWIALSVALLGVAAPVSAQTASCRIDGPTSVAMGQMFSLRLTCQSEGVQLGEVELPDLSAFRVVSRQSASPFQFQFGFGGQHAIIQQSITHTYVLTPLRNGRTRIGPFRVMAGGQRVESNVLEVSVDGAGGANNGGNPPGNNGSAVAPPNGGGGGSTVAPPNGGNTPPTAPPPTGGTADVRPPTGPLTGAQYDPIAFIRTVVDRDTVYVGQQVTATTYLYVSRLRGQPQQTRALTTDGFWVQDLWPRGYQADNSAVMVNGTRFTVIPMRRIAAFPLTAGDHDIGPMEMQLPMGDPFDVFFGGPGPTNEVRVSVPVTIHVRELPAAGRPAGDLHVGVVSLEASVDRAQVPTGEAVTVRLRARAEGNVESLPSPSLALDGLRILRPTSRDETQIDGDRFGGVRTIEWLVVPERAGTFSVGPFAIPYFDPTTGRYETARAPALELVAAGSAPTVADDAPTPSRASDDGVSLPTPRTTSDLTRRQTPLAATTPYRGVVLGIPVALLLLGLVQGVRRRRAASAPSESVRGAKNALTEAQAAQKRGDGRGFYAAVSTAVLRAIEARGVEGLGSLTRSDLTRRLASRGMSEDLVKQIIEELEGAEMARYSQSAHEPSELETALSRVRGLLGSIDRFRPSEES